MRGGPCRHLILIELALERDVGRHLDLVALDRRRSGIDNRDWLGGLLDVVLLLVVGAVLGGFVVAR